MSPATKKRVIAAKSSSSKSQTLDATSFNPFHVLSKLSETPFGKIPLPVLQEVSDKARAKTINTKTFSFLKGIREKQNLKLYKTIGEYEHKNRER